MHQFTVEWLLLLLLFFLVCYIRIQCIVFVCRCRAIMSKWCFMSFEYEHFFFRVVTWFFFHFDVVDPRAHLFFKYYTLKKISSSMVCCYQTLFSISIVLVYLIEIRYKNNKKIEYLHYTSTRKDPHTHTHTNKNQHCPINPSWSQLIIRFRLIWLNVDWMFDAREPSQFNLISNYDRFGNRRI